MKKILIPFLFLLLCNFNALAQHIISKPDKYYSVVDKGNLLKKEEYDSLSLKLDTFKQQTENELVIVIISELNGFSIEDYANQLFNEWGIGKVGKDNGILLLISFKDRKIRIETGYGIEDKLTDFESAFVIDKILTPNFLSGKYYMGLSLASDFIINELSTNISQKNYDDNRENKYKKTDLSSLFENQREDSTSPWIILIISFLIQLTVSLLIFMYIKLKRLNELAISLFISIILLNIFYALFLFFFAMISKESKLLYSTMNLTYIGSSLFLILIYTAFLLPKKLKKFLDRLGFQLIKIIFCAILSSLISFLTLFFSYSFVLYFIVLFVITAVLYYFSFKLDLGDTASGFFKGGSSGNSSNNNSSSYSTSYNNSSTGYSNNDYGGGSSGGGGASGGW
jgi:uncharacterized protein